MEFLDHAISLIPFLLAFSGGLFSRIGLRSFWLRAYTGCAVSTAFACMIYVVLLLLSSDKDPLSPSIAPYILFGSASGFVTMLLLERRIRLIRLVLPVGIITLLMIFVVDLIMPLFNFTHLTVRSDIVSPDGHYRAQLVDIGSFTPDGYYYVCLKSNSPFARWAGAHEIAGGEVDGITAISWRDDHTLVLRYTSRTELQPKANHWRDVTVQYEPQATN